MPQIFFQSLAILRDETIGPVDRHQPAVSPHRDGQQLVAHRLQVRLVAGKPRQAERFFLVPQDVLRKPLEDGPLQMPLFADENGDRPDGREGLRSQKGDGVHGRI